MLFEIDEDLILLEPNQPKFELQYYCLILFLPFLLGTEIKKKHSKISVQKEADLFPS